MSACSLYEKKILKVQVDNTKINTIYKSNKKISDNLINQTQKTLRINAFDVIWLSRNYRDVTYVIKSNSIDCVILDYKLEDVPKLDKKLQVSKKSRLIIIGAFGLFSTICFSLFPFPSNIMGFVSLPLIIKQIKLMRK